MTLSKQKDPLRPILSLCVLRRAYAENQSSEINLCCSHSLGGGEKEDSCPAHTPQSPKYQAVLTVSAREV